MAVKFSDFSPKQLVTDVTDLVGYLQAGELNVKIPPANLDTTYEVSTGNAGASPTISLQGTKPNQPAITPSTVSLTGSGATLLAGNGSTTIDFASTAYAITSTDTSPAGTVPLVLTGTGGGDAGTDTVNLVGAGGIGITSSSNTVTITGSGAGSNTTYTVDVPAATTNINLAGSDGSNDAITLVGGTEIQLVRDSASQITINSQAASYSSWTVAGDTGNTVVNSGETATIAGGTGITTAESGRTVTVNLDTAATIWTLAGGDAAGTSQAITPGNTAQFKENDGTVINSVQVGGGVQAKAAATDQLLLDQTSEQIVTMVNPGSGNLLYIDGAYQATIVLPRGFTYEFNQDASTNSGHPIEIGEVLDGSTPYATGIQYYGSASANTLTPVSQADYVSNTTTYSGGSGTARVRIRINQNSPALYYYCSIHSGMGGSIAYGGATGLATRTVDQVTISNATTGTVALSVTPTSEAYTDMYVSGVYQNKSVYSLSGSTITLDSSAYFPNGSIVEVVSTT